MNGVRDCSVKVDWKLPRQNEHLDYNHLVSNLLNYENINKSTSTTSTLNTHLRVTTLRVPTLQVPLLQVLRLRIHQQCLTVTSTFFSAKYSYEKCEYKTT